MNTVVKQIVSWADKTDMKTIPVGMLKDWVLEMEQLEEEEKESHEAENDYLPDVAVLKLVYSYLTDQVDPQPSLDLKDISHLKPEDLINYEIPSELITYQEYTPAHMKKMMGMLSRIIIRMEDKRINTV